MASLLLVGCVSLIQAASEPAREGVPQALLDLEVRALEVDSHGDLWIGVRDRGLARVRRGDVEWVSSDELPRGIADLAEIGGQLWAAGLGGLSRRDGEDWTRVAVPNEPRVIFSIVPGAASDEMWLGTTSGAARHGANGWTMVGESDGLPHAVVHQVLVDRHESVWFLCRRGLARLNAGSVEVFRPDLNFRAGLIGPDGQPWFGTSDGLLRWTGSDFVSELPGTTPYPKLVASDGSVWAGSAADGVLRHDGKGWTSPVAELRGHEVFDVAEGPDGAIWIASAVGLRRFRP